MKSLYSLLVTKDTKYHEVNKEYFENSSAITASSLRPPRPKANKGGILINIYTSIPGYRSPAAKAFDDGTQAS